MRAPRGLSSALVVAQVLLATSGEAFEGARASSVAVSGRVHLPGRSVRAELIFSDPSGAVLVPFRSDKAGRFSGTLPARRDGWTVDVHLEGPPLSLQRHFEGITALPVPGRSTAWVDLELPPVALRGRVVSEGRPAAGVAVVATHTGPDGASQTATTDAGGWFEFAGLPEGHHQVAADAGDGVSAPAEVDIGGAPVDVRLALEPTTRLQGRVQVGESPVPSAEIRTWLAPGIQRDSVHASKDGAFLARLPADAAEVGLSVAARGYALKMGRLPVDAAPIDVTLDETAGTLVLDTPSADVVLVHDGAVETFAFLSRWAAMNGGSTEENRLRIPQVEPGRYTACLVTEEELATVWAGVLPQGRCAAGELAAGGELTLSLGGPEGQTRKEDR